MSAWVKVTSPQRRRDLEECRIDVEPLARERLCELFEMAACATGHVEQSRGGGVPLPYESGDTGGFAFVVLPGVDLVVEVGRFRAFLVWLLACLLHAVAFPHGVSVTPDRESVP
ncbi:MAG: hypothetical protein M5U31_07220 [Acidimicrobiia bacterium]|nr:hypothetical protein [Acidimicrobiia bacterium]